MDVSKYLAEMKIAPLAVFDSLPERKSRVRFMLPTKDGGWTPFTWQQFADQIQDIACFLASAGIASGDRVAIYAPNRVEWASAALAIQAAGGAMVPVYPASTAEQAAYVVDHSDARVLFVDTPALVSRTFEVWSSLTHLERVVTLDASIDVLGVAAKNRAAGKAAPTDAEILEKVLPWDQARSIGRARHDADPTAFDRTMRGVGLEQAAVMLYTSGTTGNPKGVPLTHRNVGFNGRDWLECNGPLVEDEDVNVLWLPMSHIFGFGELCLGNTLGFLTYLSDPRAVLDQLPVLRPHIFMSVPSHWEKLATPAMQEKEPAARKAKLLAASGGRLRFCLSGGAGLKREIKEAFHEAGILIVEGYGLTETSPTLTLNRPDAYRFDTVGKPLPSVQLMLAEDGEILAKGPNVFGGYHKDPEATRDIFTEDGWLKTGDVGRFTEDGFLQIIDRKKDILVTAGGKNVPPANIEMRFRDEPHLAHVVVYGDAKKFLVAGVWLQDGVTTDAAERRALVQRSIDAVNAELPSYETLKKFAIFDHPLTVENGLLTASMKLKRKKVYETFKDTFEGLYTEART